MRAIGVAAAALLGLGLAACSSGPSESDVKQAIGNNPQVQAGLSMMAQAESQLSGNSVDARAQLDAATVERANCAQASGASGFVCDFRIGRDGQFGPWGKARFYQAGGSWQIELQQ